MALEPLHGERPLLGHRHRAVVEQVAVLDVVDAALGIEELDVLLQFLTLTEGLHQLLEHHLLIAVEGGGVGRVYRGEGGIPQGVLPASHHDGALLPVDAAQIVAVRHLEVGVAVDDLTLQLEHQDGDGLVHDGAAVEHPGGVGAAGGVGVGHPDGQVILAVELLRHPLQMAEVDAVAVLHHAVIVVGEGRFQDGADADGAARRSAHPDHIVVAPLDVHIVVAHQQVEDDVRPGAAVEQVAHDVELVHRQPLDQLAEADDELIGAAIFDDAADDLAVVEVLVVVLEVGVEQLIQNVAAAGGQAGPDVLPGVFGGDETADVDEAEQGLAVPLFQRLLVGAALLELGQLLVRVINEGRQLGAGILRHRIPQHDVHLLPDDAGGGVQDMYERLVLAVQVTHEVFGALGQLEQRLRADDLAGSRCLRGIVPGQKAQIFQVVPDLFVFCAHGFLQIM